MEEKQEFKGIKFDMNTPQEVELAFDGPVESFSEKFQKTNYWYGIKPLITGANGFNATEKLHETIQALQCKQGSKIKIEKVNNGKYTFFTVDAIQLIKESSSNTNTTGGDILTKDIQPEVPMGARVSELERKVKKLTTIIVDKVKSGEIVTDEEIPF